MNYLLLLFSKQYLETRIHGFTTAQTASYCFPSG